MDVNLNDTENIEFSHDMQLHSLKLKKITAKDANYVFIISTFAQLIIGLGFGIVVFLISYLVQNMEETKLYYYFVSPITELGAIFFPVLIYFSIKNIDYKKALRFNKVQLRHIFPLIVIAISAQYAGGFLNYIVTFFLNFLGKVPVQNIPIPNTMLELLYTVFIIAAIPAICEELLVRGLIMRGYEDYGVRSSIIISALLFGLMHYNLINLVFPMFLGLILGYVVYRTNSIFAGMIVHFVNNAYGVLMLYFLGKGGDDNVEPTNFQELLASSILAVIGFIMLFGFLYYIHRTTENKICDVESQSLESQGKVSLKILLHWPLVVSYGLMGLVIVTTIYKIIYGID